MNIQILRHADKGRIIPTGKGITHAFRVIRSRCRFLIQYRLIRSELSIVKVKEPDCIRILIVNSRYGQVTDDIIKIFIPRTRKGVTFNLSHHRIDRSRCSATMDHRLLCNRFTIHICKNNDMTNNRCRSNRFVLAIGKERKVIVIILRKRPNVISGIGISLIQGSGKLRRLHGLCNFSTVIASRLLRDRAVSQHIRNGITINPGIRLLFRLQESYRQCYSFIVVFTEMVTGLNFIALVHFSLTNQVTHLFVVTVEGSIVGRDRNIAHIVSVLNNGPHIICQRSTN